MSDIEIVAPVEEVVDEVVQEETVEKVGEKPQEKEEIVKEEKDTVGYWKTHSRRNEDRAKDLIKKLDEVESEKTKNRSDYEAVKSELEGLKKGILLNTIQAEYGLNESQMGFLKGDTDEELKDSARALVAAFIGERKDEIIKTPKFIQGTIGIPDSAALTPVQKSFLQFKNSSS